MDVGTAGVTPSLSSPMVSRLVDIKPRAAIRHPKNPKDEACLSQSLQTWREPSLDNTR